MIHQDIIDFQNKAIALDEKARSFSPGYYYNMQKGSLFLFDNYCPKRIPDVEDEEVLFWYFIIDLYGLFLDAGKYLKFIKKNDASWEKVRLFYDALNELRSVFCHNKPSAAFLPFVFDKQTLFGKIQDWKNRIKPLQNLVNPQSTLNKQDYHDLFDIFLCCANNILNTIETELLKEYEMYYNSKDDGQIRDKWFLELFRMFYNSESAYTRAYYEYMTGPFYPYQKASVRKIKSLFEENAPKRQLIKTLFLDKQNVSKKMSFTHPDVVQYGKVVYNKYFSFATNGVNIRELTPYTLFKDQLETEHPI